MASSDSSSSSKPAIQSKNASGGGQGEDGLVNLEESRTKFYVKKGGPYDGVYFTLDPTVVQYQETDSLNAEITTGNEINLEKLSQVLTKCPIVESLKFFKVKITKALVKLVAEKCPKLKFLELNPSELSFSSGFELNFLDEVKLLIQKCPDLENFVFRSPSQDIVKFMTEKGFGYDKIDRNFFFASGNATYNGEDTNHHQVHEPQVRGPCVAVGVFHPAAGTQSFVYTTAFEV